MKDGERFYFQSDFLGNSLEKLREEILDSFFKILSATDATKDIKVVKFIEENIPEIKKVYIAQKKFIRDELEKYWRQQTLDETFEEETEIFKIKEKISLKLEQIQNASSEEVEILTKSVKNLGTEKFREECYKAQEKEYYEKLEEKYNKLNQQWEATRILQVSSQKSSEQKNGNNGNIVDEEGILEGADSWIKKLKMITLQEKYSLLNNGSEVQKLTSKGFFEARDKEFNKLESKLDELIKEQKKIRVNELNELIERLNGFEKEKIQSKKEEQTKEEQEKEEQEKERFIYKIEKQITKDFNWLLRAEHNNDKKADEENIKKLYELYPKILKIFKKKLNAIEVLKPMPEEYYDQEDQKNKIFNQIEPLLDLAFTVFKDIRERKFFETERYFISALEQKQKNLGLKIEVFQASASSEKSVLRTKAGEFWLNRDKSSQAGFRVQESCSDLDPKILQIMEARNKPALEPRRASGSKLEKEDTEIGLC